MGVAVIQDANVFAGLSDVTTLQLHENGIQELPAGVFDSMTNLETLYVASLHVKWWWHVLVDQPFLMRVISAEPCPLTN